MGLLTSLTRVSRSPITIKAADESVASSSTLQDDDHLQQWMGANETWIIEWTLFVESTSTTPDVKSAVTIPSGAAGQFGVIGADNAGTTSVASTRNNATELFGGSVAIATGSFSGITVLQLFAYVVNGATPGYATLNWAQNTSDLAGVTVMKGSYLSARRVA